MAVFPLLADPDAYEANELPLLDDAALLAYWVQAFTRQIDSVVEHAIETRGDSPQSRADGAAAREAFLAFLKRMGSDPDSVRPMGLMDVDAVRDRIMHEHGFDDPHRAVKARENDLALALLPQVLEQLDGLDAAVRLMPLVRGIFAGNIFDLGVADSIERFRRKGADFHGTRESLPERPWLVDDYDALAAQWDDLPWRKALLFVDNAGADVVLGMLPFARELARRGATVVLAANDKPSLNDIILHELCDVVARAAKLDQTLAQQVSSGQMKLVNSGNHLPLIDLSSVSDELAGEAADVDLLVLEGMGRALESNFSARFACDTLKIAMVKDRSVANWLDGKPYDLVCRFERISRS
jgi:type II pantothenate kinase